jgi:hypothetical protein
MRVVVLVLALVATAACGAYRFPVGPGADTGHVSGTVTVVPCAPVEQQGVPCKRMAGYGVQMTFVNGSQTVTTKVNSDGGYAVDLQAGTWKVTFGGIARIISGPNPIDVPAGGTVVADYVVDSGIRAPGPAATAVS